MARRPSIRLLLLVAVGSLVLAGCGSGENPVVGPASSGATTTTTTAGADATTTTTSAGAAFSTTQVSTPPTNRGLLASVDASSEADVERITFTFEGDLPGYRVGYVERPIVEDGSGKTVEVDGDAVLGIHFEPASGFDLTGEGRQTYTGPTRPDLATTLIKDLVRTGDFEANLNWAAGLDAKAPFRVTTDPSSRQIVIEVQKP